MRTDPATIKSRLGIPAVLRAHGHTPRAGRMPCPLHGGDNRSAFSIKPGDQYARCWACGWHGDVIALEHALGGGTVGDAIKRCAELAGIRPQRAWERKPWLERQQKQREAAARQAEHLGRQWRHDWWRILLRELDEAENEVNAAGWLLHDHPDADGAWAWLGAAVLGREHAEWAVVVDAYERVMGRCGEVVGGD